MTVVSKKIKRIEDPSIGERKTIEEFVTACRRPWSDESFEEKKIDLKAPDNLKFFTKVRPTRLESQNLSFEISYEDIAKITNQVISITKNPLLVSELLKDLDNELGKRMKENGIAFNDADFPEFLIAGKGNYIPGPPPAHYRPKKKNRLLDTLLLELEGKNGINEEEVSPKFAGFIDRSWANPFVADGHIFTEDKQVSRLLLHGSMSHRIMLAAIRRASETGKLDLKYGDGKELTEQQLLELLVYTDAFTSVKDKLQSKSPRPLWAVTIDSVGDTTSTPNASKNYLNPDYYNLSTRSPFVLNSLLLCFGKELGLPNLQHYLLDSHWKAAYKMVNRVKEAAPGIDIPDNVIYTYCMEALSTASKKLGDVGVQLPFTIPLANAPLNPCYEPFDSDLPIPGIVKKIQKLPSLGEYASWPDFFAHLKLTSNPGHPDGDAEGDFEIQGDVGQKDMEEAFRAKDKRQCQKLIKSGIDFFTCQIASNDAVTNQLFNDLCEAQAKFNITKLRKKILTTDWKIKFFGKTIYDHYCPDGKVIPTIVKAEFDEIIAAKNKEKTYYAAWRRILELRLKAAKHNDDWFNFFRGAPAKNHFESANLETPVLALRSTRG